MIAALIGLGVAVPLPLALIFIMHAVLLGVATTLHWIASKVTQNRWRRAYHVVATGIGFVTFWLAVCALFWTFPTRYLIAVGVGVATYLFVWILPALLTIRERKEVLTADSVVDVLHGMKEQLEQ